MVVKNGIEEKILTLQLSMTILAYLKDKNDYGLIMPKLINYCSYDRCLWNFQ